MFDFTAAGLVGGLFFSLVGMLAFRYGKIHSYWQPLAFGATLMVYPYFISQTWLIYLIGTALTVALFVFRGED